MQSRCAGSVGTDRNIEEQFCQWVPRRRGPSAIANPSRWRARPSLLMMRNWALFSDNKLLVWKCM